MRGCWREGRREGGLGRGCCCFCGWLLVNRDSLAKAAWKSGLVPGSFGMVYRLPGVTQAGYDQRGDDVGFSFLFWTWSSSI